MSCLFCKFFGRKTESTAISRYRTYRLANSKGAWGTDRYRCLNAFDAVKHAALSGSWTQEPFETVWVEETNEVVQVYTRYDSYGSAPRCFWDEPKEEFVRHVKPVPPEAPKKTRRSRAKSSG